MPRAPAPPIPSPASTEAASCPFASAAASESTRKVSPLPPPPESPLPRWRQALAFTLDPFGFVSDSREQLGDLFTLDLPGLGKMTFVCSAELMHRIFQQPEERMDVGEVRGAILAPLVGDRVSLTLDGDAYRHRRKVVAPFLSGRGVEGQIPFIRSLVEEQVGSWTPGQSLYMQEVFDEISQRVIGRLLVGARSQSEEQRWQRLMSDYLRAFEWSTVQVPGMRRSWGPWSPWARFRKRYRALYAAFEAEARRRLAEDGAAEPPSDLLGALLGAELDEDPEEALVCVIHELFGLLVGGAETTSKSLGWALEGISSQPEALAALRRELDSVLDDAPIDRQSLPRLPYLQAVVNEGLRYQSLGPFGGPRRVLKGFDLGDHHVPAGTVLTQALRELGRSRLFPDALRFDPGHFFETDIRQRDWVPFGGGLRKCTGMGLAILELTVVIGTLVQRAELKLPGPPAGPSRAQRSGIAFQPKGGMPMVFEGRRSPALRLRARQT